MTEMIKELGDFAENTDVKVRGTVKVWFKHRSGTKNGRFWWNQGFVLQDEAGDEVTVTWWNPWEATGPAGPGDPGGARDLTELKGQSVIAVGTTDHFFSKKNNQHMISIKCSGPDGVQGAQLQNQSSASAPTSQPSTQRTTPPQTARPKLQDKDWIEWAEEAAEHLRRMPWLGEVSGDHAGAIQAALATMWIASQRGELDLTFGPFGQEETSEPKPQATEDDEEPIPF